MQSLGYIPAFGLTNLTLEYYKEVFRNPDFLSSVLVSLRIALWSAVFACILGVALSMALIKTLLELEGRPYGLVCRRDGRYLPLSDMVRRGDVLW